MKSFLRQAQIRGEGVVREAELDYFYPSVITVCCR